MTPIKKVKQLIDEGFTPKEACDSMGIDLDAAMLASLAMDNDREFSLNEIIETGKLSAARVLVDIIDDTTAENKDRIAAAKIILIGAGELPQIGLNSWEERIRRMKIAAGEIIDIDNHSDRKLIQMAS